jgi:hypothetical protein
MNSNVREGQWIQTFSGKQFWTIDPRPEEIDIEDIAHALGMMCRYNGHCEEFYSVAEHSVLVARSLKPYYEPMVALWGLLHDASEAYIADICRPTKPYLTNYKELEANIMKAVCLKFNLPITEPTPVKAADNAILVDELRQNMKEPPAGWNIPDFGLGIQLKYWTPREAKEQFLYEFNVLTNEIEFLKAS